MAEALASLAGKRPAAAAAAAASAAKGNSKFSGGHFGAMGNSLSPGSAVGGSADSAGEMDLNR
jgi:hypothetical protein